ncbi:hypothetical protein BJ508DRAFT_349614 [Ascobolus immersus RN42]|uniref:Uncharacterized protein n=1 Tax=Ascobolus immersus RN42 TaxID=1160509 RepID=A0A3N4IJY4_ASCIM|nr:hypothetical protein BJ508DRAFT_349614 [Ascobolus immersus RN42]
MVKNWADTSTSEVDNTSSEASFDSIPSSPFILEEDPTELFLLSISASTRDEAYAVLDNLSLLNSVFYKQASPGALDPPHFYPCHHFHQLIGQGHEGRLLAFLFGVFGFSVEEVRGVYNIILDELDLKTLVSKIITTWEGYLRDLQPTAIYWDDGTLHDNAHELFVEYEFASDFEVAVSYFGFLLKEHGVERRVEHTQWEVLRRTAKRLVEEKKVVYFLSLGGAVGYREDEAEKGFGEEMGWVHFPLNPGSDIVQVI